MLSIVESLLNLTIACLVSVLFLFNDTSTPEIYTLSLHDALPIWRRAIVIPTKSQSERRTRNMPVVDVVNLDGKKVGQVELDRKSTRLNSSHRCISYAVFCLKKKKSKNQRCISYIR